VLPTPCVSWVKSWLPEADSLAAELAAWRREPAG
jgi:hypothetical protein